MPHIDDAPIDEEEVTVELPPYVLEFWGFLEGLDETPEAVGDRGEIISRARAARLDVREGTILSRETGFRADLEPGEYVLDEHGIRRE